MGMDFENVISWKELHDMDFRFKITDVEVWKQPRVMGRKRDTLLIDQIKFKLNLNFLQISHVMFSNSKISVDVVTNIFFMSNI